MKHWNEEVKNRITELTVSGLIIATACFAFINWSSIGSFIGTIWSALSPFFWGFCIAFILIPLRRLFEEKLLVKFNMSPHSRRVVAVVLSFVILLLIITLFFVILIPQLASSVQGLVESMDSYWNSFQKILSGFDNYDSFDSTLQTIYETVRTLVIDWVSNANIIVQRVVGYSLNVVKGVLNFFVGLIVAIYLMVDQERWKVQFKRAAYAILPQEHAESLFYVGRLTADMLNSFVFGKALDSLVVGIACGICCGLMRMPYVPLIAFIIGITNMIPVFGPFIGAIPCIFILLIISPAKALEFGIFILILQQVDGNILGPYILGDSLGLPPIWVMFSIIVGGELWGIPGMFLGVPLFSVVYVLAGEFISRRLKEKRIKVNS